MKMKIFLLAGLLLAIALAIFISPFASSFPDGLEWVAGEKGFLESAENSPTLWNSSPMPDYAVPGIPNESFATAAAGLVGVIIVFAAGWLITRLLVRKSSKAGET